MSAPGLALPQKIDTTLSANTTLGLYTRYFALLVAWVATAGSLFFSEVLGWTPCIMCWYQRILMYPLSLIIAIGILRRDSKLHQYVLPLSLLGACVSLYHYLLIKTTWLPEPSCSVTVPCNVDYINWLGFINIPLLALTAFTLISISAFISARAPFADEPPRSPFALENVLVFAIIGIVLIWFAVAGRLVG